MELVGSSAILLPRIHMWPGIHRKEMEKGLELRDQNADRIRRINGEHLGCIHLPAMAKKLA